jgi:hypothetical protein
MNIIQKEINLRTNSGSIKGNFKGKIKINAKSTSSVTA